MKLSFFYFITIVALALVPVLQPIAKAEPPIAVKLSFDKLLPKYGCGDPVGITIKIKNTSSESIIIGKGLESQPFVMNMRIIDPAGRLLVPKTVASAKLSYHSPPAPVKDSRGKPITVITPVTLSNPGPPALVKDSQGKLVVAAPCEAIEGNKKITRKIPDISAYYHFELPGYYSAQVQLSVMQFKKSDVCNPKDYNWHGVLKSKTRYFAMEGKLPVRIIPSTWDKAWGKNGNSAKVMVQIPLHDGRKSINSDLKSIRLYNKKTGTVEKNKDMVNVILNEQKGTVEKNKDMVKVIFTGKDCIESLNNPHIGYHQIRVEGRLSNGRQFCGSQKVKIIGKVEGVKLKSE